MMPFLQKDDRIPDNYGMILHYITGGKEDFEVASHTIVDKTRVYQPDGVFTELPSHQRYNVVPMPVPYIEFVTKEDIWHVVPIASLRRWEFDRRYSKMVALKQEELQNVKLDTKSNQASGSAS